MKLYAQIISQYEVQLSWDKDKEPGVNGVGWYEIEREPNRPAEYLEYDEENDCIVIKARPVYVPTDQEVENMAREQAAGNQRELILKDENGNVRWRILPNEDGKLQVEVDPAAAPHVGDWLLNGILGIPRLENGEVLICLNGNLQGISISDLKELIDEA